MRNRNFRLSTALTAAMGSISLLLTGEVLPAMALPALLIPVGYIRSYQGRATISQRTVAVFVFIDLALFFMDLLLISADTLLAVVHLTIFFQALKSFDLNSHEDHTQVHFMGLLQIILVSELTLSVWFALVLGLFMVILVVSLMDGYLHADLETARVPFSGAALRVSAWTLVTLVGLFIIVPRTAWTGFWGKSHLKRITTTGFSDEMDFGSYGSVKTDDTVVMRVELEGPVPRELYWRGSTLDVFDGKAWSRSDSSEKLQFSRDKRFRLQAGGVENMVRQTIYLEPINTRVLFALPAAVEMEAEFRFFGLEHDRVMKLRREPRGRIRYTVWSVPELAADTRPPREAALQMPDGADRIGELTAEVTAGIDDPLGKVLAVQNYLSSNMDYALKTRRPPRGTSPIEDFLFNTRQGYCEHFSTAMTLMLRSAHIRARVVTGFLGGDINPLGNYVLVRQSDAHAWVEAYLHDEWLRFDPTPPVPPAVRPRSSIYLDAVSMAWFKYVVSYSSIEQRRAMRRIGSGLTWMTTLRLPDVRALLARLPRKSSVGVSLMALALFFVWAVYRYGPRLRLRQQGHRSAIRSYDRMLRVLRRKGFQKSPYETPEQFGRRVTAAGGPEEALLASGIYYRIRYGGEEELSGELEQLASNLSRKHPRP